MLERGFVMAGNTVASPHEKFIPDISFVLPPSCAHYCRLLARTLLREACAVAGV